MTIRPCQILDADQHWRGATEAAIRAGYVVRLFEPDGSPTVHPETGADRWRALSDATVDAEGRVHLDIEPIPESDVERVTRTEGMYWPRSTPRGPQSRLR